MKNIIFMVLFLLLTIIGCSSVENNNSKIDSALRQELNNYTGAKPIQFFGKCVRNIDDEVKSQIEATGVKVESVVKDIFTANGSAEQIFDLAELEIIKILQYSDESKLQN